MCLVCNINWNWHLCYLRFRFSNSSCLLMWLNIDVMLHTDNRQLMLLLNLFNLLGSLRFVDYDWLNDCFRFSRMSLYFWNFLANFFKRLHKV